MTVKTTSLNQLVRTLGILSKGLSDVKGEPCRTPNTIEHGSFKAVTLEEDYEPIGCTYIEDPIVYGRIDQVRNADGKTTYSLHATRTWDLKSGSRIPKGSTVDIVVNSDGSVARSGTRPKLFGSHKYDFSSELPDKYFFQS